MVVVEQCAKILQERFGAQRVIPFGSLINGGPWHAGSDLDLAVEGISSETLKEAERHLEGVVPSWLTMDLVSLERAYPEVRARILGGGSMSEDPYMALKVRLEDELIGLERIVRGTEEAMERAGTAPDEFATRALASYVDDFYKGCERVCERVAVTFDGGLPQGEQWHKILLGQMGDVGGSERPPLFSGSLLLDLDEYRRFRHRVRHIYGYELESERVVVLAQGIPQTFQNVRQAVEAFGKWLASRAVDTPTTIC
ncbi:MAG: nucleotidyltransferase domain-containing protein [Candidatus Latescibacteria bacterium]|nr:nucleotidyltransferase domain-containing protein [Candidatus Latescibacterota bacterium]